MNGLWREEGFRGSIIKASLTRVLFDDDDDVVLHRAGSVSDDDDSFWKVMEKERREESQKITLKEVLDLMNNGRDRWPSGRGSL